MTNPDFKRTSAAVTVSLLVSAALLAVACILPSVMIKSLNDSIMPMIDDAITAASAEDYASAERLAEAACSCAEERLDTLELFFDHQPIHELYGSLMNAAEIAPTEDPAQLLEELCAARTALQYLGRINNASLYNFL